MKTAPIRPGRIAFGIDGPPASPDFDDVYHPASGALQQARHVFLAGNGLPGRWAGRRRFVVLETGFGLGNNFLATWDAWRGDPSRCERLEFVSIEKHPLPRAELERAHAGSPLGALARELLAAWPLATPNLHPIDFEDGRVRLLLGFGDAASLMRQLVGAVDAFYLDGFAPARNADMWSPDLLRRTQRLAAPGATAATWSAARAVRDGLAAAGFVVEQASGIGGKRDITVARHAPRHVPAPPPGALRPYAGAREAVIVGAGLAGCAAAWALSRLGWHCRVLDREPAVARAASGNPAGIFHGSFHADDGPHARLHRAAALRSQRWIEPWLAQGKVRGEARGLLRVEMRLNDAQGRAAVAQQALPPEYVDWIDAAAAREATGLTLAQGGWWYAGGGWLAPATLATAWLEASGASFLGDASVERIRHTPAGWQVLDAQGRVLAQAPVLVLANALDAQRLLRDLDAEATLPLQVVRGQISSVAAATVGVPQPRVPVAGGGYVLPPLDGRLVFGATRQRGDIDPGLRETDHRDNLAQLATLAGLDPGDFVSSPWTGRVGFRATTADRLPLIGPVPRPAALAAHARADQPRFVPRWRDADGGLYVFTGLGSRGITWAALGAELLASWIDGVPSPVEADLRDALDPARFALRQRAG